MHTKNDETDRRLTIAVGLVVAACVAVVGWAVLRLDGDRLSAWPLVAAFVTLIVANRTIIYTRIGSDRQGVSPGEVGALLGFMLLPWPSFIVVVTIATALAKSSLRHIQPIKVAFNTAKSTVAAGALVWVAAKFGIHGPFTPTLHQVPAIAAAAATYAVVEEVLAHPVIAFATRTPVFKRFRTNWDIRLGTTAAWLTLGTAAMYLLAYDSKLVVVVPLLILGLHFASANRLRERAERNAWQQLAQATDEFNEVELDGVLHSAIRRAGELFSADEVEVQVETPLVPARLVRGDSRAISYDGAPDQAPGSSSSHTIPMPLESHDGAADVGVLRLRFRRTISLSERERDTLRTFAAALCTAVRNAGAFSEARRLSADHAHAAAHDSLTGLANRRHLLDVGAQVCADRAGTGITGLLLIDLNHFKEINDTLGHAAGDRVLAEVALRLAAAAHPDDLVARLGGDEFAVLFVRLGAPALAMPRARAVLGSLGEPIEVEGIRIVVEASGGVALAPEQGGMEELLRRADVAMYQAKQEGQQISVYTPARDTANATRLALSADLSRAVAQRQFTVDFQPVVDLGTGEVVATEALARWNHPAQGSLRPDLFIHSVERSGLLPAFSESVLDQALQAAAQWRSAGFALPVAVNISPRSVLDPAFPEMVAARLAGSEVPAEGLIIELTESVTLSRLEVVDEVLRALGDLGVRLALDDFGTGYSSLSTLARVAVHELKIDRAFVSGMEGGTESAVIRSTIDLGRSLNLMVVAEGVESEQQRRQLWELGCPAGQGHLFARPMPLPRLLTTLQRGYDGRPGTLAPALHESGSVIRLPSRKIPLQRRDEIG